MPAKPVFQVAKSIKRMGAPYSIGVLNTRAMRITLRVPGTRGRLEENRSNGLSVCFSVRWASLVGDAAGGRQFILLVIVVEPAVKIVAPGL